ncbi:MAG: Sir2 family NAD-dependent protein deacetylase [Deltaproteobacteria bacterium]|nr:Sir2 family NAD-dependent protein deacetylase [Deltaproteobacteria bacterium]
MKLPQDELLARLRGAHRIAVFTGAGISTESGIPDFRGPGGVWEKFDPNEFHIERFLASAESRRRYWQRSTEMYRTILQARPNAAHRAVTRLHGLGRLGAVITQNVDGLHQRSETPAHQVIELHGSTLHVGCLSCGDRVPREVFQPRVSPQGDAPPCERCGGLMKPATISFGQMLTPESLRRAAEETDACDLFLVVGSSLVVYPAAGLPVQAARRGVPVVILNREPTPHDDYAELVLRGTAGDILGPAVAALEALGEPLGS